MEGKYKYKVTFKSGVTAYVNDLSKFINENVKHPENIISIIRIPTNNKSKEDKQQEENKTNRTNECTIRNEANPIGCQFCEYATKVCQIL